MEEYELGKVRVARNAQDFEIASLNFDPAEVASGQRSGHEIESAAGRRDSSDLLKITGNSECSRRAVFLHQSFKIS